MKSVNVTRQRYLSDEEAQRYAEIRAQVELEKPEIIKQGQLVLKEYRELQAFIDALREAREASGMTIEELAEQASLPVEEVKAIEEHRERNPSIQSLRQYAHAMGKHVGLVLR
jgi:ribosome-binding protein aMBF1 (putative translation factor)